MACIRTRISKAGVVSYQVIVRIAGQPRLCETFKNKVKARAWGDAMSAAARASLSEFPDVKSYKKVKVRDAITVWIESGRCPRSMVSMAPSVKLMVGDTDLGHLNAEFIMKYVDLARATKSQYKRPFTDVTISKHLCLIRGAVKNEAGKHRVVPDLSIYSTANIKGVWDVARSRTLADEEEVLLRQTIPTRRYRIYWQFLVDLAIETCAREGELALMEKSEINLHTRVWTIPAEHTKANYERVVPLSEKATEIVKKLLDLLETHNKAKLIGDPLAILERRLFFVFSSASSICSGFAKLTKAANVADFHFHDLRHTAVTRMVLFKREMSVIEIMKIAGHKSMKMFLRYANLRPEDLVARLH